MRIGATPDCAVDGDVVYRTAAQVRARYGGVSDMTLWRWLHDEHLGFPQPIRINGRRFWSEGALADWESARRAPKDGREDLYASA